MKGFRTNGICVVTYKPHDGMKPYEDMVAHLHLEPNDVATAKAGQTAAFGEDIWFEYQPGERGCQKVGWPIFERKQKQ